MGLSLISGVLWRRWKHERDLIYFAVGGGVATIAVLPGFLFVEDLATGWLLMQRLALPYGLAIFLCIFFVGWLLEREDNRLDAENKLTLSEKRYRQLYESMVDISFEVDTAGIIQIISPSVTKILAYTPAEVIGTPIVDYYAIPEDREIFLQLVAQGGTVENFQVQMLHKNGKKVWLSVNGQLLCGEQGQTVGLHGLARDISKSMRAKKEREQLEQSLMESRRMESIGTLAGGIAHDFNNILGGIIGYAEIMQRHLGAHHFPELEQCVKNILLAGERAQNLIRQILAFSRRADLEIKPVLVRQVIKDVVVLMRASLPATIAIEQHLDTESCVQADKVQVHQVVMNLCTNAGHAMKEHGGILAISLDDVALEQPFVRKYKGVMPGDYVRLQVSDSGKGIAPKQLEHIFDPFYTTKKKGEGTGLGLSMVHGIISAMGGIITVDSLEGLGTRFTIYLPKTPLCEQNEPLCTELPSGTEHVVLVDDDPFLTDIGKAVLSELGYKVSLFNNSRDALQFILDNRGSIDLVLTDMTMPEMTGLDLAGWLRANRVNLPVILCTGYSEGLGEEEMDQAGIRTCLIKPVTAQQLAMAVRQSLDKAMGGA